MRAHCSLDRGSQRGDSALPGTRTHLAKSRDIFRYQSCGGVIGIEGVEARDAAQHPPCAHSTELPDPECRRCGGWDLALGVVCTTTHGKMGRLSFFLVRPLGVVSWLKIGLMLCVRLNAIKESVCLPFEVQSGGLHLKFYKKKDHALMWNKLIPRYVCNVVLFTSLEGETLALS